MVKAEASSLYHSLVYTHQICNIKILKLNSVNIEIINKTPYIALYRPRSWLLGVCILRASFCRFLVGFRHDRVLNYI